MTQPSENTDASHAIPPFVLLAQWQGGSLGVICEFGHMPSSDEIMMAIGEFVDLCDGQEPVAVILTQTILRTKQLRIERGRKH